MLHSFFSLFSTILIHLRHLTPSTVTLYSSQQHQELYLCLLCTTAPGPSLQHLHVCLTDVFAQPPINNKQYPSSQLAHLFSGIVPICILKYGLLSLYQALTCPEHFGTHVISLSSFSSHITVSAPFFSPSYHTPCHHHTTNIISLCFPATQHSPTVYFLAVLHLSQYCLLSMHTHHPIATARLTALWTYSISFPSRSSYLFHCSTAFICLVVDS